MPPAVDGMAAVDESTRNAVRSVGGGFGDIGTRCPTRRPCRIGSTVVDKKTGRSTARCRPGATATVE
jgi:hypothetical protein